MPAAVTATAAMPRAIQTLRLPMELLFISVILLSLDGRRWAFGGGGVCLHRVDKWIDLIQLNGRNAGKVGISSGGGLDLEDLVEARILKDVPQVPVDAREAQLAAGTEQALVRLEQHAQAGARDVLQPAAIQGHRSLPAADKGLGGARLGGA